MREAGGSVLSPGWSFCSIILDSSSPPTVPSAFSEKEKKDNLFSHRSLDAKEAATHCPLARQPLRSFVLVGYCSLLSSPPAPLFLRYPLSLSVCTHGSVPSQSVTELGLLLCCLCVYHLLHTDSFREFVGYYALLSCSLGIHTCLWPLYLLSSLPSSVIP